MRRNLVILSCIVVLIFSASSVQADGFGSFFDNAIKKLDSITETQDEPLETSSSPKADSKASSSEQPSREQSNNGHPNNEQPKPQKHAHNSDLVTDFNGESQNVQDYEGALTAEDKICSRIVDPFVLKDNVSSVVAGTLKSARSYFSSKISNKDAKTSTMLETAKLKAKKLNWLSMDIEVRYGEMLHEKRLKDPKGLFERSKKGRVKRLYAKADRLLVRVLSQVKEEHPYDFKLFLVDNASLNAEALPGGYLYINTGVLDSEYAELVVAHELAHVLKRHQTRESQAKMIDTVDTINDLKSLLRKSDDDVTKVLNKVVMFRGLLANYSRQQELQADACSVRIAHRIKGMNVASKIEPYVASLTDEVKPGKKKLFRQSSHPNYPERTDRMKVVVREVKKEGRSL